MATCYICLDLLSEQPDTTFPVGVAQNAGSSSQTCSTSTETSSELCVTTCGHVFHKACVLPWIKRHRSCPNCRSPRMKKKSLRRIFLPLVPLEQNHAERDVDRKVSQLMTEVESKTDLLEEKDKKIAELESEIQGKAAEEAYFDKLWKQDAAALVEEEKKAGAIKIKALERRIENLEYRYKRAKLDGHDNESNKASVIVGSVKNLTNKTRQPVPVLEVDLCDSDEDVP